jgi:hypothetical protein
MIGNQGGRSHFFVMAGLVPAIYVSSVLQQMAGTSPAMTVGECFPVTMKML